MDNFNRIQYNFVARRKQSELKFDGTVTIELRRNHRFRFICNYNFRFDEIPIVIDLSSWKLRRIHYNEKLHIFAINTSNLQTFKLIQMEKNFVNNNVYKMETVGIGPRQPLQCMHIIMRPQVTLNQIYRLKGIFRNCN